jgi:hypothetical protein
VLRGGAFNNHSDNARCSLRNHNDPDNRNNNLGFRLVVSTLFYPTPSEVSNKLRKVSSQYFGDSNFRSLNLGYFQNCSTQTSEICPGFLRGYFGRLTKCRNCRTEAWLFSCRGDTREMQMSDIPMPDIAMSLMKNGGVGSWPPLTPNPSPEDGEGR